MGTEKPDNELMPAVQTEMKEPMVGVEEPKCREDQATPKRKYTSKNRRAANMAGVNMAIRKDVVKSQSRRSSVGNLVAKHTPFPFILTYLRLPPKGVQKMRTNMNREK